MVPKTLEDYFSALQTAGFSRLPTIQEYGVTDEMIAWKTKGTELYQQLPADCHDTLKEVEPLREVPENMKVQDEVYKTLRETFKK